MTDTRENNNYTGYEIAVIGMAGRFPGAASKEEFWKNLKQGKRTICMFSDEELLAAGVDPALPANPKYVKAKGMLEDADFFDASFFNYTLPEAEVMDPQLRILHECAWTTLEDAGYNPDAYEGRIGFYVGASTHYYWISRLINRTKDQSRTVTLFSVNDGSTASTQIAYRLNLKGPALTLQTACSTSLVAIHCACQALLSGECDMALAGGVSLQLPAKSGYIYQEGMILSPDGHNRSFDARAGGTVTGNGVGVVMLKPLDSAIADRDFIYALVKGTAVNNDGSRRIGYSAPSVKGQAEVISLACQAADVEPESITYVEGHGTATPLGDPVEIRALTRAFASKKKGFCRIGSVKSNIGHLDAAAGVAGFIKTVLSLQHKQIPPSLDFTAPNPEIDFENSPFSVNTELTEAGAGLQPIEYAGRLSKNKKSSQPNKTSAHSYTEAQAKPLRAGVSSFGIGGTNAHVILEEWGSAELASGGPPFCKKVGPKTFPAGPSGHLERTTPTGIPKTFDEAQHRRGEPCVPPSMSPNSDVGARRAVPFNHRLILLSARTEAVLERNTANLAKYLTKNPQVDFADVAFTLQAGRKAFEHRRALVCREPDEAVKLLSAGNSKKVRTRQTDGENPPLIFMFPGLGSQYVDMGYHLYRDEPVFRREMDLCFDILNSLLGYNIRDILYPGLSLASGDRDGALINNPDIAQLVVFIFEYALSKLLLAWGLKPTAMIGYSFGEYTAACTAGVFTLEDALKLVMQRGRLIIKTRPGAMLSVPLQSEEIMPLLGQRQDLVLAIDNGPSCIIAGPKEAVDEFAAQMKQKKYLCMHLDTSYAIHSPLMEPIAGEFVREMERISLNEPQIPYMSNLTGKWMTPGDAVDPAYWGSHLTSTVHFAHGIEELVKESRAIFVEIGPGRDLSALIRRSLQEQQHAVNLVRPEQMQTEDTAYLLERAGLLWLSGIEIDWNAFYTGRGEQPHRVPLPAYSFEKQRFVLDGEVQSPAVEQEPGMARRYKRSRLPDDYEAPRDAIEEKIAATFRTIFGLDRIGIHEDFFELGGDSLKVITLITSIHRQLDVDIPMDVVFKKPTVKEIAVYIGDRAGSDIFSALPPVEKREYYPLSPAQQRVFVVEQIEEKGMAYNMPSFIWMEGDVDTRRFEHACRQLLARHESLRTGFFLINGKPVQRVYPVEEIDFEIEDYKAELASGGPLFVKSPTCVGERLGEDDSKMMEFPVSEFQLGANGCTRRVPKTFHEGKENRPVGDAYMRPEDQQCRGEPCVPPSIRPEPGVEIPSLGGVAAGRGGLVEAGRPEPDVQQLIEQFVRSFDLASPPLWRIGLFRVSAGKHLLLSSIHHIVSDDISIGVMIDELSGFYKGKTFAEIPVQYKEYAVWLGETTALDRILTEQREFWLGHFSGKLPLLELPMDFPRPPLQSFAGAHIEFTIDLELTNRLNELARQHKTTLFVLLFTLYNVLLYRYTGQEDIIVGTPITGRSHRDVQQVVGMFVNTLALRSRPRGDKTFADFLQDVKEETLQAFANQAYQFEDLVEELEIRRDMSRNPLFDTMFVLHTVNLENIAIPGVQLRAYEFEHPVSKFDITLNVAGFSGGLNGVMEYSTDLFKDETMQLFKDNLIAAARSVVENPLVILDEIESKEKEFDEAEMNRLLYEFNETAADFPAYKRICEMFSGQVKRTPGNRALIGCSAATVRSATAADKARHTIPSGLKKPSPENKFLAHSNTGEVRSLTYEEFSGKVIRAARFLKKKGVQPGTIVILLTDRSLEMMIAMFAVIKAGGAYLPVDPNYPRERINYMIADSGAPLLLTPSPQAVHSAAGLEIIDLASPSFYEEDGGGDFETAGSAVDPAYVIYTSGSTGKPKGVVIEHRSLINRLHWMQKAYPINEEDVLLQKTPIVFDVSLWELFWWSFQGAALCLLEVGGEKNPAAIITAVESHRVTVIHFVPSMLNIFMEYLTASGNVAKLNSLRRVFASGEALAVQHVTRFHDLLTAENGTELVNLYGPTEATVDVSYFDCVPGETYRTIPIGKPIDNTRFYILDKQLQLQPMGVPGELCIAGAGLSRGYLNNPELTMEKFIASGGPPFCKKVEAKTFPKGPSGHPGAAHHLNSLPKQKFCSNFFKSLAPGRATGGKLYKTGDLARWLPDGPAARGPSKAAAGGAAKATSGGIIEFLGRIDHQVKIRGFRIEPGEIESRLIKHDAIKEAAVLAKEDGSGERYLYAYLVSDRELEVAGLREFLVEELPDYMVPSFYMKIDRMPLTTSGKINRNALDNAEGLQPLLGTAYAAPSNDLEKSIAQTWQKVLNVDKVGIDDNFFDSGGNSLRVIRVVSEIKEALKKEIPVVTMFRYPTVRSLANFLSRGETVTRKDRSKIKQKGRERLNKKRNLK